MQFKIMNTEFKISFTFLALILIVILQNFEKKIIITLIFAVAHEMIHLILIYLFSVAPKRVSLNLFGADILRDSGCNNSLNAEILINISAPLFNLLICILCYSISVFNQSNKDVFNNIADCNFVLGVFNLIPFYNFDGGNALNAFLLKYINVKTACYVITIISVAVTLIFSILSIYIFLNYQHNMTLIFISLYMIFCIIFKK